jgi:hypothetical protein
MKTNGMERARGGLGCMALACGRACGGRARGTLIGLLAGLAMTAAPGVAQESIDETRPLRAGGSLEIRTLDHNILLIPWDRDEVRVRGEYDPRWERLEIRGSAESLNVELHYEGRSRGRESRGSRTLELQVPAELRLDAGSVSGSIEGEGLRGTLGVASVSGSVRLTGLDVEAANITSVSGSLQVGGRGEEIRARTVSGTMRVNVEAPVIAAQSVSGRVTVEGRGTHRRVEMGAVSGGIAFQGALGPRGELKAESHSGSVELIFNRNVDARFHLSTFSGSIRAELEGMRDRREERGRFAPGETLTFTTGDGLGRVEARSFSGRLRIGHGG